MTEYAAPYTAAQGRGAGPNGGEPRPDAWSRPASTRAREARSDRAYRRGAGLGTEYGLDHESAGREQGWGTSSPSPRSRARGRPGSVERALSLLLLAAAAAALVAAAAILLPPALRITRYDVEGSARMSREEVLSAALIHDNEYFFSVDPQRIRSNLLAEPRIADAEVSRVFPSSLRIRIAERQPVASVLVDGADGQRVACIDSTASAFALADPVADAATLGRLPVISGIRFEGFRPGTKLPDELGPLFASLAAIEQSEPALLAAFSEIRIDKPRFGAPELLLYPVTYRIPVRAAADLNASTLRSIILVLDVLASRGLGSTVEEIDFRTGTVVYRSKEGQSG